MKLLGAIVLCTALTAQAQTREEWIALGERVHGGFGAFIPLGIRIGQDALRRLDAAPREVTVLYFDGEKTPCPCIADGIMLAVRASPGQGTLRVAPEKARAGLLGAVVLAHRKSGRSVRYEIPAEVMARVAEWNKALGPAERYDAVMGAAGLFTALEPSDPQAR